MKKAAASLNAHHEELNCKIQLNFIPISRICALGFQIEKFQLLSVLKKLFRCFASMQFCTSSVFFFASSSKTKCNEESIVDGIVRVCISECSLWFASSPSLLSIRLVVSPFVFKKHLLRCYRLPHRLSFFSLCVCYAFIQKLCIINVNKHTHTFTLRCHFIFTVCNWHVFCYFFLFWKGKTTFFLPFRFIVQVCVCVYFHFHCEWNTYVLFLELIRCSFYCFQASQFPFRVLLIIYRHIFSLCVCIGVRIKSDEKKSESEQKTSFLSNFPMHSGNVYALRVLISLHGFVVSVSVCSMFMWTISSEFIRIRATMNILSTK